MRKYAVIVFLVLAAALIAPAAAKATTVSGADIGVTQTANRTALVKGDTVTFTSVVTNHGPDPATEMDVEWIGIQHLLVTSQTCGDGTTADTPGCEWGFPGPFAVGTTRTMTIKAKVLRAGPDVGYLQVCLYNNTDDPSPDNDCASNLLSGHSTTTSFYFPGTFTGSTDYAWEKGFGTYTTLTVSVTCLNETKKFTATTSGSYHRSETFSFPYLTFKNECSGFLYKSGKPVDSTTFSVESS